ncbi:MAG: polymerase subunit sigma-70 [Caulobacter sp.]|nr:polymerase subunit sigma-70 [Caulobacter sp.]
MTPESLDAELVEAARRGSPVAFGRLVERHQRAVRAFLRRACGDAAEADDLAQETFIAAWERIARFRGEAGIRTWFCGIAWRKLMTARRSWFRSRKRDADYVETEGLERGEGAGADERIALEQALAGLPIDQRAVVALCLGGDFSHSEAAEALGLPLGTVKSHVARGKARLMQTLGVDHE